jgi:hypothetical protein
LQYENLNVPTNRTCSFLRATGRATGLSADDLAALTVRPTAPVASGAAA